MKIKLLQQILRLHFYGSHLTFSGQTATRNVSPQDQTAYVRDRHKPPPSFESMPSMAQPQLRSAGLQAAQPRLPRMSRAPSWQMRALFRHGWCTAGRGQPSPSAVGPGTRHCSASITTCLLSVRAPLAFLDATANTPNTHAPNNLAFLSRVCPYRTDRAFKTARKS